MTNLPSEILPETWHDDARMNSLYAPVRNRATNSQDWDSKVQFWKSMIYKWCEHYQKITFTQEELKQAFKKDGRSPGCLQDVLRQMFDSQELESIEKFSLTPLESWSAWAVNSFIKTPATWSFNKVVGMIKSTEQTNTIFVNIKCVRELSQRLVDLLPSEFHNKLLGIIELSDILKKHNMSMSEENLKLCLHYLRCHGKVVFKNAFNPAMPINENILLKVGKPNEKVEPINDIEFSTYELEKNERALIQALEGLESEKEAAITEARSYLSRGMKQMAKNSLRKKRQLEKNIEKRTAVLENLQILLSRIKEAECDSKVVESYRKGLKAIKNTLKDAGLSEDNVDDVIDDVHEVLDIHQDIQATLSQSITSTDDAGLEEELEELLAENKDIDEKPNDGGNKDKKDETKEIEALLNDFDINLPSPPKTPLEYKYLEKN